MIEKMWDMTHSSCQFKKNSKSVKLVTGRSVINGALNMSWKNSSQFKFSQNFSLNKYIMKFYDTRVSLPICYVLWVCVEWISEAIKDFRPKGTSCRRPDNIIVFTLTC